MSSSVASGWRSWRGAWASTASAISLVIGIDRVLLAFGPGLLGVAHDLSDSYGLALRLCIALDVVAAVTILWRERRAADAASAAASG
jgi:cyanate permease